MKAILENLVSGAKVEVKSSTQHPDSSYGQAVWVDKDGVAYTVVGFSNPFYRELAVDCSDRADMGQYFRHRRLSRGVSIRTLADEAGLSPATIVNMEGGRFYPRLDVVAKIATALGLRLTLSPDE